MGDNEGKIYQSGVPTDTRGMNPISGAAGQRLRGEPDRGDPLVTLGVGMNCSPVPSFMFLSYAYNHLLLASSLLLAVCVGDKGRGQCAWLLAPERAAATGRRGSGTPRGSPLGAGRPEFLCGSPLESSGTELDFLQSGGRGACSKK